MKDRIVLITGATSGIGKQAAIELSKLDAHIIIHGRTFEKADRTQREILSINSQARLSVVYGDFSSFYQIQELSNQIHFKVDRLDVLVNNAGIFNQKRKITKHGIEETFQINVLAPYILVYFLYDLLVKSNQARIVNVSSQVQATELDLENLQGEKTYNGFKAYGISKTCLNMVTLELAELFKNTKITVNYLHPGVYKTQLSNFAFGTTPEKVSKTLMHVITSPLLNKKTGLYFQDEKERKAADITYDQKIRSRILWICEDLSGISFRNLKA
jgi:NAD(P)-dependent dehydrogenase (short-subunit alcohol dehydrogenase family)